MVSRRAPAASASRIISANPRVIRAARALESELEAVADAGGHCDHVFDRAPELDSDDVRAAINAELPYRKKRLHPRGETVVTGGCDQCGGLAARDFGGKSRSRKHGNPARRRRDLAEHRAHRQQRVRLEHPW